jgi:hypothetical protein
MDDVEEILADEQRPTALVLMKLEGDSWQDKTYSAIASVLREAGLAPIRSDEIRSSGPVVEEVCRLIRTAELVVVDSSGNSHSVSYEIGYAHGADRDFETLVHLRSEAGGQIPFNYAHYRALIYRDRGHLKRKLREHLRLSTPLLHTDLGFVINLEVIRPCQAYGELTANAILDALDNVRFDGRCEYYAADGVSSGTGSEYFVGLGCKVRRGSERTPDLGWWTTLVQNVSEALLEATDRVRVDPLSSEMGEMSGIRQGLLNRGAVEFRVGQPRRILSPKEPMSDSWFVSAVNDRRST